MIFVFVGHEPKENKQCEEIGTFSLLKYIALVKNCQIVLEKWPKMLLIYWTL